MSTPSPLSSSLLNQFQQTKDIFNHTEVINICQKFLRQAQAAQDPIVELYARAKLNLHEAAQQGNPSLEAIRLYQELAALARRNGDTNLEAVALCKQACGLQAFFAAGRTPSTQESQELGVILGTPIRTPQELAAFKKTQYTHALSLALGQSFATPDAALTAVGTARFTPANQEAVVAAGLALANQYVAVGDLTRSYKALANIINQAPEHLTVQVCAVHNRIKTFVQIGDEVALAQAITHLQAISIQAQLTNNVELSRFAATTLPVVQQGNVAKLRELFSSFDFHSPNLAFEAWQKGIEKRSHYEVRPVATTRAVVASEQLQTHAQVAAVISSPSLAP